MVLVSTILFLKMLKGTKKIVFGGMFYLLTASLISPEIVNPYYNSKYFISNKSLSYERLQRKLKDLENN